MGGVDLDLSACFCGKVGVGFCLFFLADRKGTGKGPVRVWMRSVSPVDKWWINQLVIHRQGDEVVFSVDKSVFGWG